MPRFIALPVGQGDAFYLDRGNWSVLVDGGRSTQSLESIFRTTTGAGSVDVLVCTHNDADHANGILGFLESGLDCNEVWLPGRWLSALPDLLRPFTEVFVDLVEQVAQENLDAGDEDVPRALITPLEQLAETHGGHQQEPGAEEGSVLGEDGWPADMLDQLEQTEPWYWDGWPWPCCPDDWPHPIWLHPRFYRMGPVHVRLLWSAIYAAKKIREIATAAFHRGIPVRWFEYDVNHSTGGCADLQPLNAKVIARVRPVDGTLLRFLALTVANKESLVFWSPPAERHPGVLFNADSDLAGVNFPNQLTKAISTAPHHGSKANANAYTAVATAAGQNVNSITWVRSDGRYRSGPGPSYLGFGGRRFCTICRYPNRASSTKHPVHLFARQGAWIRHPSTLVCSCK